MVRNPGRRAALTDAAIAVLASAGARGLTFRAVDTEAEVPAGTASNYFRNRDDLFDQIAERIHSRLTPDSEQLRLAEQEPASRDLIVTMMRALVRRVRDDPTSYLALSELRLEAARRPELREVLTRTVRDSIEREVQTFQRLGLPGDRTTVVVIYLAMNGLITQQLTLPDTLPPHDAEDLVQALIAQLVPEP